MTTSRTGNGVSSGDGGNNRRGRASAARAAGQPLPAEGPGILMADIDFSHVNIEYLICARDLARSYPERAAVLLGATPDLVRLLAEVDPATLVAMTPFRAPLLVLRREPWWLRRLFTAFRAGRTEEVWAVLDQEGLIVLHGGPGGAET